MRIWISVRSRHLMLPMDVNIFRVFWVKGHERFAFDLGSSVCTRGRSERSFIKRVVIYVLMTRMIE